MAIDRPGRKPKLLRDSIEILPEVVSEDAAKEDLLVRLIEEFKPTKASKGLVFVTARWRAEELASRLNSEIALEGFKARPFHAGMSQSARSQVYEEFLTGEVTVLCATKAFGMGMDIPDIHLVVHYGPPASLEDYIQEVGRAARSQEALAAAVRPHAQAVLLYAPEDFRRMRDRLKDQSLSTIELQRIHEVVVREMRDRGVKVGQVFPIEPVRLGQRVRGSKLTTVQVRLGLHWLERLNRLKVGDFSPVDVQVRVLRTPAEAIQGDSSRRLFEYLYAGIPLEILESGPPWAVPLILGEARRAVGFSSNDEVLRELALLFRDRWVEMSRMLDLGFRGDRWEELRRYLASEQGCPLLEALLGLISVIEEKGRNGSILRDQLINDLENQLDCSSSFRPEAFGWVAEELRAGEADKNRRTAKRKVRSLLSLLVKLGVLEYDADAEGGLAYVVNQKGGDVAALVRGILKALVVRVFSEGSTVASSVEPDHISLDWLLDQYVTLVDSLAPKKKRRFLMAHLQSVIDFLSVLGYLARSDQVMAPAIDITVTSEKPILLTGKDALVLSEFSEFKRARLLRLSALECLATLASNGDKSALRRFIEEGYFQARDADALLALLEEYLGSEHEIVRCIRGQALEDERLKNDADQDEVYNAPIDRHLMVLAGPGSGKTRILLLRLARLLHDEDVPPRDILVLAFTRAVVSELRSRLRELMRKLGYSTLANRVWVTTFHSFAMATLRQWGNVLPNEKLGYGRDWLKEFCLAAEDRNHPARLTELIRRYAYVFVDEFQDVHGSKLELLTLLRGRDGRAHFFVVGDDDQSIYDYESGARGDASGGASNLNIFENYRNEFKPEEYKLTINYRSSPVVVDLAQELLLGLRNRQKTDKPLKPYRKSLGEAVWAPWDGDVRNKVQDAQSRLTELRQESQRRQEHDVIAVLARTNKEVYRLRALLQNQEAPPAMIVQGMDDTLRLSDRRDVAAFLKGLSCLDKADSKVAGGRLNQLLDDWLESMPQVWRSDSRFERHELRTLADAFLRESGADATFMDFVDYVDELSTTGDFLRVALAQGSSKSGQPTVLISTIHKVKGLEFPAVLMPRSDLRVDSDRAAVDFEVRVQYVGMTRAEDVLYVDLGEREEAIRRGKGFRREVKDGSEVPVYPSLGDVWIGFYGGCQKRAEFIENHLSSGEPVELEGRGAKWRIVLPNVEGAQRHLGWLANPNGGRLSDRLTIGLHYEGLEIAGIYRRYTSRDEEQWRKGLAPSVLKRGFYHVVVIAGLARKVDGTFQN